MNIRKMTFFCWGTCRPYKPSAVLSRKGTGRREMTERRDAEKPRYRDAEFHRERPELRAKIQDFIIFVILQASSLLRRDPVLSRFLFIGGLFWFPIRFLTKHWICQELHQQHWICQQSHKNYGLAKNRTKTIGSANDIGIII